MPNEIDRAKVHSVIFDELCCGIVKADHSRQALEKIVQRGKDAGADSVILGCTEICLSLTDDNRRPAGVRFHDYPLQAPPWRMRWGWIS